MKSWTVRIGMAIIAVMLILAVVGPALSPNDINAVDIAKKFAPSSIAHPCGFDEQGRDLFSRILFGARVSLMVGISVVFISGLFGLMMGMIAGYAGGIIDKTFLFVSDVFMAFPGILLAIAIASIQRDQSIMNVILILSVVGWVSYARLVRAQVLSLKEREYIESARAIGASHVRICFRYFLPNIAGAFMVQSTFNMAGVIMSESTLSFLGLGVPVSTPSWGAMLDSGVRYLLVAPHLSIYPGIAIALTVLGFNFIGEGLRDWLDPKAKKRA